MLDRVFKLLKEESLVAGAISARDFQAFTLASLNGHIEIVRQIHKWWNVENYLRSSTSSAIPSLQLLEAKKFRCFSAACYGGHLPLARKLFNYAIITPEDNDDTFHHTAFVVDKRLDMVTGQGTFTPLLLATQQGHLATIQQIFSMLQDITTTSSYSQIILDMIRYEEFIIFRTAVSKGFLEISKEFVKVLQSLSSSSSSASILQEMISAKDYIAFISAASNGHLQLVEMLYASWSSSNETQTAMLSAQGYAAFYESSQNGHVGVVEKMLGWASDAKKEEIIKGEDFLIFRLAAQSGHVAMMRLFHHAYKWKVWPLDVLNHHHDHRPQLDLIQSSNFFALREASRNGFYDVVDILFSQEWASTSTIQTAMLQADGYACFLSAVSNGHYSIMQFLF